MPNGDPSHPAPGHDASRRPERQQPRPALVVFDVNETLSDTSSLAERFEQVRAPAHLAISWFAGVLRDGFALTAAGTSQPFARIASETLRATLHGVSLTRSVDAAVGHVMEGFASLPAHADLPDAARSLAEAGIRLVTLSNGAAAVAEGLLDRAGARHHFEALLSVEDADAWKPAAGAYAYALERCGVQPGDAMLVAVHPWDIDGAARAGLSTTWIDRTGAPYPAHFRPPDLTVGSLGELTGALAPARG